jgi:hypothetical protein
MIDAPARFGVCTLRVEVQPEHLLITVTTIRFLAPGARRALPVRSRSYTSVREALEATEEFLDSFGTWNDSAANVR